MKLFVRGLFAGAALAAVMLFSGCGSPSSGPAFLSDQQPPAPTSAGQPITPPPNGGTVARFHVGDNVIVSFSGAPDPIPDHAESIKEDGTITLPLIGAISAVGKTTGELQNEIHAKYVPQYYMRLTVTVKSGDRVYYVGGEVNKPGIFQYVSSTSVTKAIQSAGGLTEFANHGKVWLTHANGGQRIRLDYDQALQDPTKDPPVYPNDQINVERRIF